MFDTSFILGMSLGLFLGLTAAALMFGVIVPRWLKGKSVPFLNFKRGNATTLTAALLALLVFTLASHGVSFAQETPVPLDIPINDIMTSTNSWLTTFAPIAAIGIGISIALAVLGYLGKMIKSAFT